MSSVSPAARDLSTLLNDHRLPNTLNYTNDATTGTSRMSDAACERISERVRMVASPTLHAQYLQPLLQQYTSLLSRTAKESLSARFKRTTEDAQVEAEKQKLSGEMGLSHYVKSYLIDPLNALLREEPLAGLRLYWRFLGTGTAAAILSWCSRTTEASTYWRSTRSRHQRPLAIQMWAKRSPKLQTERFR